MSRVTTPTESERIWDSACGEDSAGVGLSVEAWLLQKQAAIDVGGASKERRYEEAAAEIERLKNDLLYAYRCVACGLNTGRFDFTVLRQRAIEALQESDALDYRSGTMTAPTVTKSSRTA